MSAFHLGPFDRSPSVFAPINDIVDVQRFPSPSAVQSVQLFYVRLDLKKLHNSEINFQKQADSNTCWRVG